MEEFSTAEPLQLVAGGQTRTEPSSRKTWVVAVVNMVFHAVILSFLCFITYLALPGSSLFSWHPFLMSVSFGGLMYEGILVMSSNYSLFYKYTRANKITAHWVAQTISAVAILIGFIIIVVNKLIHDKPHFVTWHAIVGLVAVVAVCIQCLGGVATKYSQLFRPVRPATLKLGHAVSGLVVCIVSCIAMVLGFYSNWYAKRVNELVQVFSSMVPITLATLVLVQVSRSYLYRFWRN